jgi:hypothetical protein
MATGGGRISLPLAIGVDRGHPQWPDLSLFFFFFGCLPKRQKWPLGVAGSLSPSHWGGSRPLPVARSFFFFFLGLLEKSPEMVVGGGICSLEVGGG